MAKVTARDGRVLGRRGAATREKLLTSLSRLLENRSWSDIGPADVARGAGVSLATFYEYFRTIDAAVLALGKAVAARDEVPSERLSHFLALSKR